MDANLVWLLPLLALLFAIALWWRGHGARALALTVLAALLGALLGSQFLYVLSD